MKNTTMKNLSVLLLLLMLFFVSSWAQEPVVEQNVTVFKEKNRFAGWPANNGIWFWGEEIILRNDSDSWDLGYPRTVQRSDGKIVTVYYYKDTSSKERYISATIWDPGKSEKK